MRTLSTTGTPLLAALALLALPAPGAAQTPTPVIQFGSPCPAVIQVSWDVSAIDGAARIRRRVKADFASGVLDTTIIEQATGSETIDLRTFGPVLDGTSYTVEIRAKDDDNGNLAGWSDPAVFDTAAESGAAELAVSDFDPMTVELKWLPSSIVGKCASGGVYEVAAAPFSVTDGPDPSAVTSGELPLSSGSNPVDLSPYGEGTYHVRITGRGADGHTVGLPGPSSSIQMSLVGTIAAQVTDLEGAACGTGPSPAAGATVMVKGGPFQETTTVGASGVATVQVPKGAYVVTAARGDCVSEPVTVQVAAGEVASPEIEIPDCPPDQVDLAAAIAGPASPPLADQPFQLQVTISSDDDDGPSAPRAFVVTREDPPAPRTARGPRTPTRTRPAVIGRGGVEALCPGEAQAATVTETGAPAGSWTYRVRLDEGDADQFNDMATAAVTVEAVPEAAPPPEPAAPVVDLALAAEQSHETLDGGETMTYTVSLTNAGQVDLYNVVVRLNVSTNLDLQSATGSHNFECAAGDTFDFLGEELLVVLCEEGDLVAGATATITLNASLPFSAGAGHYLFFSALADPFQAVAEADESNNTRTLGATTGEGVEPVELVDHVVPDPLAAIEYAEDRGFTRYAITLEESGGGRCVMGASTPLTTPRFVFVAESGLPSNTPTHCEFRLLQGPDLASSWTIAQATLEEYSMPSPDSYCTVTSTTNGIRIRVLHAKDPSPALNLLSRVTRCWLDSLTLNGPVGGSWQDAFE